MLQENTAKSEDELRYDNNVKLFLSQKIILAHILVNTVEEFSGLKPEDVVCLIDGEPEVSSRRVHPKGSEMEDYLSDSLPRIQGIGAEDVSEDEGTVFYDIRFCVYTPTKRERLKLILDVEAQNDFYPGYDLVTRSIYYCARMLSSQKNTEFTNSDYDEIKKVYSIWICVHVPKYAENTLTEYRINQKNIIGQFPDNRKYDLLSSIFICLSEEIVEKSEKYRLHRLLETFFSTEITKEEKRSILENEYAIIFNREIERSVNEMCNVSKGILQKGYERGMAQGIEDGMAQGMAQGIAQGMEQLSNAVLFAKENHISSFEELVEHGFSKEVAKAAIVLL